jgi:hypothetical protein
MLTRLSSGYSDSRATCCLHCRVLNFVNEFLDAVRGEDLFLPSPCFSVNLALKCTQPTQVEQEADARDFLSGRITVNLGERWPCGDPSDVISHCQP